MGDGVRQGAMGLSVAFFGKVWCFFKSASHVADATKHDDLGDVSTKKRRKNKVFSQERNTAAVPWEGFAH